MIELRLVETQGSVPASQSPGLLNPSLRPPPARGEGEEEPRPLVGGGSTGNSTANAVATGPGIIPARIDAQWHNREPAYPPDAAQRREAGTVLLLIHVGLDGAVEGIDVAASSGFPQLDRAARTAVATWHFLPAVHGGRTIASDMELRVVFQLKEGEADGGSH